MKSDEDLFIDHLAGDQNALPEIDHRWRENLLSYTLQRVTDDAKAGEIVADVFAGLAAWKEPIDYVRTALYTTAHHFSGATCDWRNGMVLFQRNSPLEST